MDEALKWGKEALFGRTGPRGGQYDGLVQNVVKGEMRRMGRELVRGALGSLLGGRRRRTGTAPSAATPHSNASMPH